MGAVTMETDNPIAEKNRELALRRELEGLPREQVLEKAVRASAENERLRRELNELADAAQEFGDLELALEEAADLNEHHHRRIRLLERVFRHGHKAGEENLDTCARCGLDIRDPVHERRTVTKEAGDA